MCVRRDWASSAGDNCCGYLDVPLWCVEGSGCCWGRRRVKYGLSVFSALCFVLILTGGLDTGTSASSPLNSSSFSDSLNDSNYIRLYVGARLNSEWVRMWKETAAASYKRLEELRNITKI